MFNGTDLLALQTIDREYTVGQRRLTEIGQALDDSQAVVRARQTLENAQYLLLKHSVRQKDLELESQSVANKTTASETQLYSGTIKNPKELSDLQARIKALGRRQQSLEDNLLEAMISREDAEAQQDHAHTRLDEIERAWSAKHLKLQTEQQALKAHLRKLVAEKERLIPGIDRTVLSMYDQLWKRKNGLPVAEVKAGSCGACGVSLSPGTLWKLRQGELVQCGNCERILVRS